MTARPPSRRKHLWGWSVPARRILSGTALVFGVALLAFSPEPSHPEAVVPVDSRLTVDPNTAPPAVLNAIPRLGPVLVGRIVAERQRRAFTSLDDLDARVPGIGPATVTAIGPYLRFGREGAPPFAGAP